MVVWRRIANQAGLCYNVRCRTGEVPERPIGAVSKTVVEVPSTVGSNPTLSASQQTFGVADAHTATLSAERKVL